MAIEKDRVGVWERGIRSMILEEKRNMEILLRAQAAWPTPSEVGGSRCGVADMIFQVPTQKTEELLPESSKPPMQRQDDLLNARQHYWEIQKSGEHLG